MSGYFTFTGTLVNVKISPDGKTVNLIFPFMLSRKSGNMFYMTAADGKLITD